MPGRADGVEAPVYYDFPGDETPVSKFVLSGSQWRNRALTWCVEDFTDDMTREAVLAAFDGAFDEWGRVSSLRFARLG